MMDINFFRIWQRLPSGWKRKLHATFYQGLARLRPTPDVTFMNFGYADLGGVEPIALEGRDASERYPLQLYDFLARDLEWHGLDVLEVGCGRGGGASYIKRRYGPKSYLGLDLASQAIRLCRRLHQVDGLRFQQGDAMNLPLADSSVDVVVNVESSGLYPDIDRFYDEVHRVLRPGGRFLCADYRKTRNIARWKGHIASSRLDLVREVDITDSVARALELNRESRTLQISRHVPRFLHATFMEFAGLPTHRQEPFSSGEKTYLCLELCKEIEESPRPV